MLKGKTAIVTGGSRGIGAAVVRRFSQAGVHTAVIYAESKEKAEELCRECAAQYGVHVQSYHCDVADLQAVKETVACIAADFGTVDILVNNAGITRDNLIGFMKEEEFDAVMSINLKGTFNMIKQCSRIFIRQRNGSIVNLASVSGEHGNAGQCNYAASKAGIIGLTKSAAKELAKRNIRCNAVSPGFIDTDMTRELVEKAAEWVKTIPLGRAGEPEEVAEAVVFLADAPYITGEVLHVDGGMGM